MRKLFVCISLLFFIIPYLSPAQPNSAQAAEAVQAIDASTLKNGIVGVKYTSETGKKIKVAVEKSGSTYYYDLPSGKVNYLPLQMKNGKYNISVFEQTQGNQYKMVEKSEVNLQLKDPNQVFLQSVQNISWNKSMKPIKKADKLTSKHKKTEDKIKVLHSYITKNVKYDYQKLKTVQPGYLPSIENTFKTNKGICYDYSSLFAAMLRSEGIPAKVVMGYTPNVEGYHAWNEVYIKEQKKWVIIDTTVDAGSKKKASIYKKASQYKKEKEY